MFAGARGRIFGGLRLRGSSLCAKHISWSLQARLDCFISDAAAVADDDDDRRPSRHDEPTLIIWRRRGGSSYHFAAASSAKSWPNRGRAIKRR